MAANLELEIFPNPSDGRVNILTNAKGSFELSILNILGEKVFENISGQNQTLDLSHLPLGQYFVTVKTEEQIITKKILLIE